MSGRPGSNRPPIAWKAIALPNELLPHLSFYFWCLVFEVVLNYKLILKNCGQWWIRTTEVERQRIYSPPHLATLVTALKKK